MGSAGKDDYVSKFETLQLHAGYVFAVIANAIHD